MENSLAYILLAIFALLLILLVFFRKTKSKSKKRFTPMASLAFAAIIAGIFLGDGKWYGYAFMGLGILLAVIDIFRSKD